MKLQFKFHLTRKRNDGDSVLTSIFSPIFTSSRDIIPNHCQTILVFVLDGAIVGINFI